MQITDLPESYGLNHLLKGLLPLSKNLSVLVLEQCRVESEDILAISASIRQLQLKELRIKKNFIERDKQVSGESLYSLFRNEGATKSLRILDFSRNQWDEGNFSGILKGLQQSVRGRLQIEEIDFSGNEELSEAFASKLIKEMVGKCDWSILKFFKFRRILSSQFEGDAIINSLLSDLENNLKDLGTKTQCFKLQRLREVLRRYRVRPRIFEDFLRRQKFVLDLEKIAVYDEETREGVLQIQPQDLKEEGMESFLFGLMRSQWSISQGDPEKQGTFPIDIRFRNFSDLNSEYLITFLEFTRFIQPEKLADKVSEKQSFWRKLFCGGGNSEDLGRYRELLQIPGHRRGETLFLDLNSMQDFQTLTSSEFDLESFNSIYSLVLQRSFYEALKREGRQLRYSSIVFQGYIKHPNNYMEVIKDDRQVNKLIECFNTLKYSNVRKVIVNYEWSAYSQNDLMKKQDEMEVAQFIQFSPPSECEFQNFSVNFLRLLYAESYMNPNFRQASVSYDGELFVNSGIGGSLKESVFKKERGGLNSLLYQVYNAFVGKQEIYRFDHTVIQLEQDLQQRHWIFWIVMLMNILLILTSFVLPLGLYVQKVQNSTY